VNFQSTHTKQKQKKFPQNLIKSWDVTWAAVLAQQGDPATVPGVSAADPSMPAAISGLLNPLFAAQAEALSAELKALYAGCLEDVF
jgi:hypothetical protein